MYYNPPPMEPIRTESQKFWGKVDHGIGGSICIGICLLLMALGIGYPWWSSLFVSLPIALLLNWAVWVKEAHILRL